MTPNLSAETHFVSFLENGTLRGLPGQSENAYQIWRPCNKAEDQEDAFANVHP